MKGVVENLATTVEYSINRHRDKAKRMERKKKSYKFFFNFFFNVPLLNVSNSLPRSCASD